MKKKEKKNHVIVKLLFFIPSVIFLVIFSYCFLLAIISNKEPERSFISNEQVIECKNVLFFKKCKITYVPNDVWKHDLCFNQRYFFKEPESKNVIVYNNKYNATKCSTKSSEISITDENGNYLAISMFGIIASLLVLFELKKWYKGE